MNRIISYATDGNIISWRVGSKLAMVKNHYGAIMLPWREALTYLKVLGGFNRKHRCNVYTKPYQIERYNEAWYWNNSRAEYDYGQLADNLSSSNVNHKEGYRINT